jgi:2-aminoethylphosphonate-pyruvate transaminase
MTTQMPSQIDAATSETGDPLLLTPGPITTSRTVKEVMLHDWGSRDDGFLQINRTVLEWLPEIVRGAESYVAVPVQGSGTFAVEAMLTTLVPPTGKCLVLINGGYGERARKILDLAKRQVVVHRTSEDAPPDLKMVDQLLERNKDIGHVFAVHCETTSGILNPISELAELVERHGRRLLIDAMSAFGALPLDSRYVKFDAVAASSNKCIEGVPGLGFVICLKAALAQSKGNATTLVLDLHDQWQNFVNTGQYRFTPPIHVIVSFQQALKEFFAEGGQPGRGERYGENAKVLIDGMRKLGFSTLLPDHLQAPIIVTFRLPEDPKFTFKEFYDKLKCRGYVIYPGKLTVADSFRIGCIGRLYPEHLRGAVEAVRQVLAEMGVTNLKSAA